MFLIEAYHSINTQKLELAFEQMPTIEQAVEAFGRVYPNCTDALKKIEENGLPEAPALGLNRSILTWKSYDGYTSVRCLEMVKINEANEDIRAGRIRRFDNAHDMIASLKGHSHE